MRRALCLALLLLLAGAPCSFAEPPKAEPRIANAADAVLAAWRSGDEDAMRGLANTAAPDRMRVVMMTAFRAKDAAERRAALERYADATTDASVATVARAWATADADTLQEEIALYQRTSRPASAPLHGHPHGPPPLEDFTSLPALEPPSIHAAVIRVMYARALAAAGRRDESFETTAALLRYADEMGWPTLAHQAHVVDGETWQGMGRRSESADAYWRAADAAAQAQNPLLESRALQFVIIMLGRLGRLPDRYAALMRMQELAPQDGTIRTSLHIQLWLAAAELDLGVLDEAETRLASILERAKAQGLADPARKARVLQVSVYAAQGRMDRAVSQAQHILDDPSFQDDSLDRRRALATIAATYHRLGLRERALELCRAVIAEGEQEATPAATTFGSVLVRTAALLRELGRDEEAHRELERALALYRQHKRMTRVRHALGELATLHLGAGRLKAARKVAAEHAVLAEDGGSRARSRALGLQGTIALASGHAELAVASYESALRLAAGSDPRPSDDAWLMAGLGRAQLVLGKHADAATTLKRATVLLLGMAGGLGDRHAFTLRDRARNVAMDGFRAVVAQGDKAASDAWWFREAGQALLLAQTIRNTHSGARGAAAPRDRWNEAHALRALARAQTRLVLLQATAKTTPAKLAEARKTLDAAHAAYERVASAVDAKTRTGSSVRVAPVELRSFQERLGESDAALAYVVGKDAVHGIAVRRDAARIVSLGAAPELREQVEGWRELASTPDGPAAVLGRRLHERLLEPFESQLRDAKRLVVLPEAELAYVPFGALVERVGDDGTARRYVLDRFEVAYAPSGSVLHALDVRTTARAKGHGLLALGDPAYPKTSVDKDDPPLVAMRDALSRLQPLAASGDEVRAIAALYPETRRRALLRQDATLEGWRSALAKGGSDPWRAVHLACHGLVDPARPRLSGLVFGGGGILNVEQIHRAHIPADLVVLSACNTVGGALSRGEGVIGLARGFFQAGAARVAMSTWRVADAPTAKLMTAFHRAWVKGAPAASALRAARLALRGEDAYAHPYYWAPFVLWGAH